MSAYSEAVHEAWVIVNSVADGIAVQIADGSLTTLDQVTDMIIVDCDDALIYTHTHYICVWGLPEAADPMDRVVSRSFSKVLASQACENLREAVTNRRDWEALLEAQTSAVGADHE